MHVQIRAGERNYPHPGEKQTLMAVSQSVGGAFRMCPKCWRITRHHIGLCTEPVRFWTIEDVESIPQRGCRRDAIVAPLRGVTI
jgi:hypothetical protein